VDTDPTNLCAVVFAAGEGVRMRPITLHLPKPLCPVGNVALLDAALARVAALGLTGPSRVAVNASYLADQIAAHVGDRVHLSREPAPLGTAGGLRRLRSWIDGRAVLAVNSDAYLVPLRPRPDDLWALLDGWDGVTVRILTVPAGELAPEFGDQRFAGASLLPADLVAAIPAGMLTLTGAVWRPAERAGRLELIPYEGYYADTGTPRDLWAANVRAAAGACLIDPTAVVTGSVTNSIVGAGAVVAGSVTRSVVFPGARVAAEEVLVDVLRVGVDITIPATRLSA